MVQKAVMSSSDMYEYWNTEVHLGIKTLMFFIVLDEMRICRSVDHKLYPDPTLPEIYYWWDTLCGQNSNKYVHIASLLVIAKTYDVVTEILQLTCCMPANARLSFLTWANYKNYIANDARLILTGVWKRVADDS